MLGYGPDDLRAFQSGAGLKPDDIPSPNTRAALHKALRAIDAPAAGTTLAAIVARLDAIEARLGIGA
jgi:peptidoglycan hydrolase-like protein with peptidoglycan-binding domain